MDIAQLHESLKLMRFRAIDEKDEHSIQVKWREDGQCCVQMEVTLINIQWIKLEVGMLEVWDWRMKSTLLLQYMCVSK
jgi:hypothetical protein